MTVVDLAGHLRRTIASVAIACVLGGGAVAATDTVFWAKRGDWIVMIDRTLESGCYASRIFETGMAIRIGLNRADESGLLLIGNDSWKSLKGDRIYPLTFDFDTGLRWTLEASPVSLGQSGETRFLSVTLHEGAFLWEFSRAGSVDVSYRGAAVAALPLNGSYDAIREVVACHEAVSAGRAGRQGGDPFRSAEPDAPRH